jgi:hypothetical protein
VRFNSDGFGMVVPNTGFEGSGRTNCGLARALHGGKAIGGLDLAVVTPDVLGVGGDAGRKRVRATNSLKPGRRLPIVNRGIIAAEIADQFVCVGVALCLTVHDAARLTPQDDRPAMPSLNTVPHVLPPPAEPPSWLFTFAGVVTFNG